MSVLPANLLHSIEHECLAHLGAGRHEALLTLLMREYGRDLHRYCWNTLRDRALADDVLQNVFVQAHAGLSRFQGRSSFKVWLYGIARHRCLDELRRRRRWARMFESLPEAAEPAVDSHETAAASDVQTQAELVMSCVDALPTELRELIVLRFVHNTEYSALSTLVGESAGALRTRVCRTLVGLRGRLEQKVTERELASVSALSIGCSPEPATRCALLK